MLKFCFGLRYGLGKPKQASIFGGSGTLSHTIGVVSMQIFSSVASKLSEEFEVYRRIDDVPLLYTPARDLLW